MTKVEDVKNESIKVGCCQPRGKLNTPINDQYLNSSLSHSHKYSSNEVSTGNQFHQAPREELQHLASTIAAEKVNVLIGYDTNVRFLYWDSSEINEIRKISL